MISTAVINAPPQPILRVFQLNSNLTNTATTNDFQANPALDFIGIGGGTFLRPKLRTAKRVPEGEPGTLKFCEMFGNCLCLRQSAYVSFDCIGTFGTIYISTLVCGVFLVAPAETLVTCTPSRVHAWIDEPPRSHSGTMDGQKTSNSTDSPHLKFSGTSLVRQRHVSFYNPNGF
jgi:hypothetical protein